MRGSARSSTRRSTARCSSCGTTGSPYSSLTGLFAPTLKRLLALHAAREEGAAAGGGGEAAGGAARLLPQLRALDWSRRAKYHSVRALLPLLPRGAATLLELWPSVLREIFASLRIPNYASYASELLADLLTSLRQQLRAPAAADAPAADPPPKTKSRRGRGGAEAPASRWKCRRRSAPRGSASSSRR